MIHRDRILSAVCKLSDDIEWVKIAARQDGVTYWRVRVIGKAGAITFHHTDLRTIFGEIRRVYPRSDKWTRSPQPVS